MTAPITILEGSLIIARPRKILTKLSRNSTLRIHSRVAGNETIPQNMCSHSGQRLEQGSTTGVLSAGETPRPEAANRAAVDDDSKPPRLHLAPGPVPDNETRRTAPIAES